MSDPKLTKAQIRTLQSVADGVVVKHFDVWGGYWWTEAGKRLAPSGASRITDYYPPLPIKALLQFGFIAKGELARPYSGKHETPYVLTAEGRAALSKARGETTK